ncbi:macrophage mannose receptor 1-like [Sardina pilchardus]|uniref:macrophage mannose receptor 1-like n=1 Tax=Sardina pilchardus TaxID=27697 RepID=UPI002E146A12
MTLLLMTTLLVSGLVSLSSSVPRQFHVVKEQKSWTEAQQYCREKFTDLATIDDMTEMEKVKSLIHEAGAGNAWIGLKRGDWQWSLADRDFYGENEAEFRNWAPGQPNGGVQECVAIRGKLYDNLCSTTLPFIGYDGGNSTHPYVLVTEEKTWADAQRYCRENHTDLASVRNQAENDQIEQVRGAKEAWIGLFRAAWSDGSSSSFRHWGAGEPDNQGVACTEIEPSGQWKDTGCQHRDGSHFICYEDSKEVKRQIVRVEIKVASHVNIHDPAVQQAFLQQIQQRLRDSGMPADAKLTWRRQPDGKIFKEKEEKKEEGRKRTEL